MAEPLAGRLRRAEAALRESFAGPEAEWLERRRRVRLDLLREHVTTGYDRLKTRHADGASGAESVRAHARFMDDLLRWLFDTADGEARAAGAAPSPLVLVALGGYGRGELHPSSDLDLMLIYGGEVTPYVQRMAQEILYTLWDLGLRVGHACRSLDDCLAMARTDLPSRTSMQEARVLAGDQRLFRALQQMLRREVYRQDFPSSSPGRWPSGTSATAVTAAPSTSRSRTSRSRPAGCATSTRRCGSPRPGSGHAPSGSSRTRGSSPPRSGRRPTPRSPSSGASGTSSTSWPAPRTTCSSASSRPRSPRTSATRTTRCAWASRRFMRDYYLHARAIHRISARLIARCQETLARRGSVGRRGAPAALADGLVVYDGRLHLAEPGRPPDRSRPHHEGLLARPAARLRARRRPRAGPRGRRADPGRGGLAGVARAESVFLSIRRSWGRVATTLRRMHDSGVLGAYLPEFGALDCLVQYDVYHRFSADQHSLLAVESPGGARAGPGPESEELAQIFARGGAAGAPHARHAAPRHRQGARPRPRRQGHAAHQGGDAPAEPRRRRRGRRGVPGRAPPPALAHRAAAGHRRPEDRRAARRRRALSGAAHDALPPHLRRHAGGRRRRVERLAGGPPARAVRADAHAARGAVAEGPPPRGRRPADRPGPRRPRLHGGGRAPPPGDVGPLPADDVAPAHGRPPPADRPAAGGGGRDRAVPPPRPRRLRLRGRDARRARALRAHRRHARRARRQHPLRPDRDARRRRRHRHVPRQRPERRRDRRREPLGGRRRGPPPGSRGRVRRGDAPGRAAAPARPALDPGAGPSDRRQPPVRHPYRRRGEGAGPRGAPLPGHARPGRRGARHRDRADRHRDQTRRSTPST